MFFPTKRDARMESRVWRRTLSRAAMGWQTTVGAAIGDVGRGSRLADYRKRLEKHQRCYLTPR